MSKNIAAKRHKFGITDGRSRSKISEPSFDG